MKTRWTTNPTIVEAELYEPGMEDGWYGKDMKFYKSLDDAPNKSGTPIIVDALCPDIIMPIKEGDYIVTNPDGSRFPTTLKILKTYYKEIC